MKIVTENGELNSVILNKEEAIMLAKISGLSYNQLKELGKPVTISNWYTLLGKFIPESER